MRHLALTLIASPKAVWRLLLPFIVVIFLCPSALTARDVSRLAKGSCVTTHLARFAHAVRYKDDPQGPVGTHAVFTNRMTMRMADDDRRVASWIPGDEIYICKVLERSPWMCDENGECINLLMLTWTVQIQNVSRHEPQINTRAAGCAENIERCRPGDVM